MFLLNQDTLTMVHWVTRDRKVELLERRRGHEGSEGYEQNRGEVIRKSIITDN